MSNVVRVDFQGRQRQASAIDPARQARRARMAAGLRVGLSGLFSPQNSASLSRYIEALANPGDIENEAALKELACALIVGKVPTAPRKRRQARK